ncbi:HAD-like protein [Xylaria bambusicola]|uniref:HAD-like protein n=1 Tax=Xylaria bambusicola TaxID=326684 RepID=UPI002007F07E|nr:HAD-like protein [Xylaria bambusicola]KAI0521998.1 HAD-like protein [Xylaria bambusicola]
MAHANPRRFAPLGHNPGQPKTQLPKLQGVIFDVDGTLCLPQNYMFVQMRSVLGIPKSIDILTHISSLPTPAEREAAMDSIRAIEREAMSSQVAQPGLATLMTYLQERGIRKAICTRNFETPVTHLLSKFLSGIDFAPIVTRDFRPPKPDPAGLLFIARSWGLVRDAETSSSALLEAAAQGTEAEREGARGVSETGDPEAKIEEVGDASTLIMVGDSIDDMTAGRHAGAATVLLVNSENAHLAEHPHTDLVIKRLDELVGVLESGFVGREMPISSP